MTQNVMDWIVVDRGGRRRTRDRRNRVTAYQGPERRSGWQRRSGWDRRYRQLNTFSGKVRRAADILILEQRHGNT